MDPERVDVLRLGSPGLSDRPHTVEFDACRVMFVAPSSLWRLPSGDERGGDWVSSRAREKRQCLMAVDGG